MAQRLDSRGAALSSSAYDAYEGVVSQAGDPKPEPFGCHAREGYYQDVETGLLYCQNRYYDPQLARWVTRDPIDYEGGINLYGYCGNGPVGAADPSGLMRPTGTVDADGGNNITSEEMAAGWSNFWGEDAPGPDGNPVRIGGFSNALNHPGNIETYNGTMHAKDKETYNRFMRRRSRHWQLHEEGHIAQNFTVCGDLAPYLVAWGVGIGQEFVTGTGSPSGNSGNPYGHDYNVYETYAEDYARRRDGKWELSSSPHTSTRPWEEWAPGMPWVN